MTANFLETLEAERDRKMKDHPQELTTHALITAAGAINRNLDKFCVAVEGVGVFSVTAAVHMMKDEAVLIRAEPICKIPAAPAVLPGQKTLPITPDDFGFGELVQNATGENEYTADAEHF